MVGRAGSSLWARPDDDGFVVLDPRTPVIVGVAQVTDRVDDPTMARTAVELMIDACRSAGIDAAGCGTAVRVDMLAVVGGIWSYRDPGRQVADALGASNATTLLTGLSGTSPQRLLAHLAELVADGRIDAALMTGGEVFRSRHRARRFAVEVRRDVDEALTPAERFEGGLEMATPHEESRGLVEPGVFYPIVESAIRHDRGETVDQHRRRVGALWASFNEVACANPHAATRTPMDADAITTPSGTNRMVAAPYTRAMMANNNVDQASAVLLTSVARAETLGVPRDRWVFPHVATRADDPGSPSVRMHLHRSPGARVSGTSALAAARLHLDEVDHLDLYACFPASVQVCATELGLDADTETRPLTANGGLTFAGGPHSNSVGQSLAALVGRLREAPGTGLLYANGGYLGKHAFGIYGTEPPAAPFHSIDGADTMAEQSVDGMTRQPDPGFAGTAIIDGYTVRHDRDGLPTGALVASLSPAGARVWGGTTDRGTLDALLADDLVGQSCELDLTGQVAI